MASSLAQTLRPPDRFDSHLALERSILRGLAVLRWVSLVWVIGVALYSSGVVAQDDKKNFIRHPVVLVMVLALATAVTLVMTRLATLDTARALRWPMVLADVGTAVALYLADGYVFEPRHVFYPGQSLTASWPVCAVASMGIAFGPFAGLGAGFLMGFSRFLSALINGFDDWKANSYATLANTTVFSIVWGFVAGWVAMQMRRAENEVATARAREDFARTMHDSVLQTLALVERRTRATDPELADSARRTDRDLRAYLFGGRDGEGTNESETLLAGLRRVVDRAIIDHRLAVELSVVEPDDDATPPDQTVVKAIVGATSEALTNAAKHANASKVVVFCDLDDGPLGGKVFVSIHDDGVGFDRTKVHASRRGLVGSIEGRMTDIGGRAEIVSNEQQQDVQGQDGSTAGTSNTRTSNTGTEVRLWGP